MQISVYAPVPLFQPTFFSIAFHFAFVPLYRIVVSPVQPENAEMPMLVTLDGIVMLVSPVQSLNAEFPMLVTLDGIVTFVS